MSACVGEMSFALISLPERSKLEFTRKHRDLVDINIVEIVEKFIVVKIRFRSTIKSGGLNIRLSPNIVDNKKTRNTINSTINMIN